MVVETKEVTVTVTKETAEVYEALQEVVKQAKAAGKDGFQAVTDIPAVLMGSFNKLSAAVDKLGQIPTELKEKLPEFIQANAVGAGMVAAELARPAA